ncbi:MAG: exodeoxyribonuclease VII large subunit [Gammaproteobacteria bacterium]
MRKIFSVSELNRDVAALLEQEFAWIWVEAEISNLARPASGHLYFSLKDDNAQLRCAMFRSRSNSVSFKPENGQQVMVRGKVSLYQPRGDYQLIVDRMEAAGEGALRARFEALKNQLAAEGLFDAGRKRPIPAIPVCIGVITSNTGAAIRDVLSVIGRRFPSVPVKLFPVPVQGDAAAPAICAALRLAEDMAECDVLLLVRGGGSLEDLWAFNEASVARAVAACKIPVVSGVGHETDTTIADFVADLRAATPTAAAEAVTPDRADWQLKLVAYARRLQQRAEAAQKQRQQELRWLKTRLWQQHPVAVLQGYGQRLDEFEQRLLRGWRLRSQHWLHRQQHLGSRLLAASPLHRLQQGEQRLQLLVSRMQHRSQTKLEKSRAGLERLASTLNAISPLNTLARGYSITCDENGHTVTDAKKVAIDRQITSRLHKGRLISKVIKHLDD